MEKKQSIVSELENIKRSIRRIEEALGFGEEDVHRYFKLLKIIYDAGGAIKREDFHSEGVKLGYDPRGLGGFFAGKNPVLTYVKLKGQDHAALTDEGYSVLEDEMLIE